MSTIARNTAWSVETNLKFRLLIAALLLVLVGVVSIGVPRLLQSLDDGTIGIWRLVLAFANAFGCVTIVWTLYARGRKPRPTRYLGRARR
jgi:uncharacterized membrane protein